jgi:hypothetical protein|nr:MAG TPA: hypothetical protein [Caudoviricetes sp.]DAP76260.1 MAG TPA: hypothetical protein [Caudoviricetes sp.]
MKKGKCNMKALVICDNTGRIGTIVYGKEEER